eukprot:3553584-Rhodomonas_salina.1
MEMEAMEEEEEEEGEKREERREKEGGEERDERREEEGGERERGGRREEDLADSLSDLTQVNVTTVGPAPHPIALSTLRLSVAVSSLVLSLAPSLLSLTRTQTLSFSHSLTHSLSDTRSPDARARALRGSGGEGREKGGGRRGGKAHRRRARELTVEMEAFIHAGHLKDRAKNAIA